MEQRKILFWGALVVLSTETTASTTSLIDEGMCTPSYVKYKFHCAFPWQERRTELKQAYSDQHWKY